MWKRLALSLMLMTVAACGQLPRPFQPAAETAENALISPWSGSGIRVDPVQGTTGPMSKLLAQSVTDALMERDIPAAAGAFTASRYVLTGVVRPDPGEPSGPVVAVIDWTLKDRTGKTVAAHSLNVTGPRWKWEFGDPGLIEAIGAGVAEPIAVGVAREAGYTPPVPSPKDVRLLIKPVIGAPGDGNQRLEYSIRAALKNAEVGISRKPAEAAYILGGTVSVGPPRDGQQDVHIVWTVETPDGEVAGKADQRNAVPAGSLDGAWGQNAALAALAAVDGIKEVLTNALRLRPPPIQAAPRANLPDFVKRPKAAAEPSVVISPDLTGQRRSAATAIPAPPGARRGKVYSIELASVQTAEQASQRKRQLVRDYPGLMQGLEFTIALDDLGTTEGMYYRLIAGPLRGGDEARRLCLELVRRNQGCLILPPNQ